MKKQDYTQPEFLFCEIPVKNGSFHDNRTWIYHRLSLSLIEFIYLNDVADFEFQGVQEVFLHNDEEWIGVFVQNNTELVGADPMAILRAAWAQFEAYLGWEDNNISDDKKAANN